MMKKTFFILLFFISSCGYQPIYINKSSEIYEFKKIILNGDNYINNKIINILSIKENDEIDNKNILHITSSYKTEEISKNSKGHVTAYRIFVEVNLIIEDIENNKLKDKFFRKDFLYNVEDDKFKTSEYQREIENNLTNQIVEEALLYFNL